MKFANNPGGRLVLQLVLALLVTVSGSLAIAGEDKPTAAFESLRFSFDVGMMPIRGNIEVAEDGSYKLVETTGGGPGAINKTAKGDLSEKDLKAIQVAIAAIDWDQLKGTYFNPMIQDAPGYTVALVDGDGKKHRVSLDGMAKDTPKALKQLYVRLNTLYRAQQKLAK